MSTPLMCDCNQGRLPCTCKPAEQHQGEPVAWVIETEDGRGADYYIGKGLDTLEPGTKLYTHADPAEVERLRAQLAERDALLLAIHDGRLSGHERWLKIEAALSASAEPGAPVCNACKGTGIEYDGAGHDCTACGGKT